VFLPPYAPELNPAERVFEEIRRQVEGCVYESLEAKEAVVERYLVELAATPERVRRLCAWTWIEEALQRLSSLSAA
jgi:transposase